MALGRLERDISKGPWLTLRIGTCRSCEYRWECFRKTSCARGLRPVVWGNLEDGQSGYIRGTDDPLLVLYEVLKQATHASRTLYLLLGDFKHAFPYTWREDLLLILAGTPGIDSGCLSLLGSVMALDLVLVRSGGFTIVPVKEGLPEGGAVGSLAYTSLPNTLVRRLQECGAGLALSFATPPVWAGHAQQGAGTPDDGRTVDLVQRLVTGASLPDRHALAACTEHRPCVRLSSIPARVCVCSATYRRPRAASQQPRFNATLH